MQVVGANLVPTSLQTQNLITETLLDLLASDHVFLIRLTNVDEITAANGTSIARMTYIMQKNTETPDINVVCLCHTMHHCAAHHALFNLCCDIWHHCLHHVTFIGNMHSVHGACREIFSVANSAWLDLCCSQMYHTAFCATFFYNVLCLQNAFISVS